MKRILDVVVSAGLLLLLLPLLCVVALCVRVLGGPGPVIFRQVRAGRGGVPFRIAKFRTMVDGAEGMGAGLAIEKDDPRVFPFGEFLRKTSLDELPQLWNVLRGDMSLVGPRPLPERYVARYSEEQRQRLDARPGITGLAQIRGRNDRSWEEKFADDVEYVRHQSLALDVRILWQTAWKIVKRDGITAADGAVREFMGTQPPVAPGQEETTA